MRNQIVKLIWALHASYSVRYAVAHYSDLSTNFLTLIYFYLPNAFLKCSASLTFMELQTFIGDSNYPLAPLGTF